MNEGERKHERVEMNDTANKEIQNQLNAPKCNIRHEDIKPDRRSDKKQAEKALI